jgi:hypothetical protein
MGQVEGVGGREGVATMDGESVTRQGIARDAMVKLRVPLPALRVSPGQSMFCLSLPFPRLGWRVERHAC